MHLFSANPQYWLLAAALIPPAVHLLSRSRPKDRPFGSLFLLRSASARQAHVFRPKDYLILALRTLALLSLAAAFLLPFFAESSDMAAAKSVVLVVDTSASMGASDGQQRRLQQAEELAEKIVSGLNAGDTVNLITVGAQASMLFEQPEPAVRMVLGELSRLQSLPEEGDAAGALRLAVRQAASNNASIVVISDFQGSNWASIDYKALIPEGIRIQWVNVARRSTVPNTWISSLAVNPRRVTPGERVDIRVALGQCGNEPVRTAVHLEGPSLRVSQVCEIPAKGTAEAVFTVEAPAHSGEWQVNASIDPDGFPKDDRRTAVIPLVRKYACDTIASDPRQLGFLLKALESLPLFDCRVVPGIGERETDFLVWHAPRLQDVPLLEEKARAGTVVLALPGFSVDSAARALCGEAPGQVETETAEPDEIWQLASPEKEDRIFSLFAGDALAPLLQAGIFCRLNAGLPHHFEKAAVLLRYEDGVPALVRRPVGNGALLLWNIPVQAMHTRWGASPLFVPFLAETLLGSRMESDAGSGIRPGLDHLACSVPPVLSPRDIALVDEKDAPLPVRAVAASGGYSVQSERPVVPGIYRWRAGNETLKTEAVNFPAAESPLTSMDISLLPSAPVDRQAAAEAHRRTRKRELWPWLVGMSLLFLAAAQILASHPGARRNARTHTFPA